MSALFVMVVSACINLGLVQTELLSLAQAWKFQNKVCSQVCHKDHPFLSSLKLLKPYNTQINNDVNKNNKSTQRQTKSTQRQTVNYNNKSTQRQTVNYNNKSTQRQTVNYNNKSTQQQTVNYNNKSTQWQTVNYINKQ